MFGRLVSQKLNIIRVCQNPRKYFHKPSVRSRECWRFNIFKDHDSISAEAWLKQKRRNFQPGGNRKIQELHLCVNINAVTVNAVTIHIENDIFRDCTDANLIRVFMYQSQKRLLMTCLWQFYTRGCDWEMNSQLKYV